MKTIYVLCGGCKKYVYMRITLTGVFWVIAKCDQCGNEYRYDKVIDIIEKE